MTSMIPRILCGIAHIAGRFVYTDRDKSGILMDSRDFQYIRTMEVQGDGRRKEIFLFYAPR